MRRKMMAGCGILPAEMDLAVRCAGATSKIHGIFVGNGRIRIFGPDTFGMRRCEALQFGGFLSKETLLISSPATAIGLVLDHTLSGSEGMLEFPWSVLAHARANNFLYTPAGACTHIAL
jgi:hypothetical protein